MFLRLLFIVIIVFIYIHVYIHLHISKYNELNTCLLDINNNELSNKIYNKLPFIFNAEHIETKTDLSNCIIDNDFFIKTYEPCKLLEPSVKFFTKNIIYKKNKHYLHYNLYCRTFYKPLENPINFIIIHPKYKNNFIESLNCNYEVSDKIINYIKNSKQFINITVKKDEILFIPNYWIVYYELNENQMIECLHYSTILNQASFIINRLG